MKDFQLPKITKVDFELMVRAHAALVAAHAAVHQWKSPAQPMVLAAINQADELIARLYNKCEQRMLDNGWITPEALPVNDQAELTVQAESNGNLVLLPGGKDIA